MLDSFIVITNQDYYCDYNSLYKSFYYFAPPTSAAIGATGGGSLKSSPKRYYSYSFPIVNNKIFQSFEKRKLPKIMKYYQLK